jgi:hypothetical protein
VTAGGIAVPWHYDELLCTAAQVMRLRDENEALMETLVRTKVELAETQGTAAGCPRMRCAPPLLCTKRCFETEAGPPGLSVVAVSRHRLTLCHDLHLPAGCQPAQSA